MEITHNNLPQAIQELKEDLAFVKQILLEKSNTNQPDTDRWLNLNQLVEYDPEQRTKATFYGYIHRREIPFHKRGKKLTFLQSEINDWLKQGRQQTVAEIAENTHLYLKPKKGGNNG